MIRGRSEHGVDQLREPLFSPAYSRLELRFLCFGKKAIHGKFHHGLTSGGGSMTRRAIQITLAVACALTSQRGLAAVCANAVLDGDRTLVADCGGACGVYQVGSSTGSNLGFGGTLPDVISFEFYSADFGSYPQTGTFDLGSGVNANYATCQQCIIVFQDYSDPSTPTKTFFQTAGSITIDSHTIPGVVPYVGLSWSDVMLAEVTIDPDTFMSTLVPDGDCYAIIADVVFRNGFDP